jgi:hypothetical protein
MLQLIFITLTLSPILRGQALNRTAADNGSLAGTLTNTEGKPAPGVRIAALDISDTLGNDAALGALVSIAETDEDGRYRLEMIPPGRYLITAGRVDNPTFYPGAIDRQQAKVIIISSGAMITGVDFRMDDGSIRLFNSLGGMLSGPPTVSVSIPVDIKVEGGARVPIFASGKFPFIRLSRTFDHYPVEVKLNAASTDVPLAGTGITEYRASVEDLPEGYVVQSILYGSADLRVDTVKITPPPGTASSLFALAGSYFAGLNAALAAVNNTANSPPARAVPTPGISQTSSPNLPISTLMVTLATVPVSKPINGVRISGHATGNGLRSAYISGIPGIYFSDGSFEFRGVPAGRQFISIVEQDSRSNYPRGASIIKEGIAVVVADQDIDNVELEPISMLPPNSSSLMTPGPATAHAPGPLKMSVIHGRVEDDAGQPLGGGTVIISAQPRTTIRIGSDGRFEIPHLLPGSYDLEIGNFLHETVRRTVEIEEGDVELDVTAAGL